MTVVSFSAVVVSMTGHKKSITSRLFGFADTLNSFQSYSDIYES